jgi:hypothetical protein
MAYNQALKILNEVRNILNKSTFSLKYETEFSQNLGIRGFI